MPPAAERALEIAEDPLGYCRAIEAYLCRKNDGHLVRVVGPAFEVVAAWQHDGVPFKVACEGIDRAVERYYRKGPRRRPLRIEFCDADVRDVFDEWRRATGVVTSSAATVETPVESRRGTSLPEHLERALLRLTNARVMGRLTESADPVIDEVSSALDEARQATGGLRGDKRQALLQRLSDLDVRLGAMASAALESSAIADIEQQALDELAPFRADMPEDRFERAKQLAVDRLMRSRLTLPSLKFR